MPILPVHELFQRKMGVGKNILKKALFISCPSKPSTLVMSSIASSMLS